MVSHRYHWNIPALIGVIVAAIATTIYGLFVFYVHGKLPFAGTHKRNKLDTFDLWHDQSSPYLYSPGLQGDQPIEDEMTRRQMLTLLLQKEQTGKPVSSPSTYHIDIPEDEPEGLAPPRPVVEYYRTRSMSLNEGAPMPARGSEVLNRARYFAPPRNGKGRPSREERRRQIESG